MRKLNQPAACQVDDVRPTAGQMALSTRLGQKLINSSLQQLFLADKQAFIVVAGVQVNAYHGRGVEVGILSPPYLDKTTESGEARR